MKKTYLIIVALLGMMLAVGCQQQQKTETAETNEQAVAVQSVDDVLANASTLVGDTVVLEGVCTHICQHGGKKIFLMGSDDTKTIRIEASEQTGAFSPDCVNSMVEVKGVVAEERIDEAYLLKWEEEIKAQTAEEHGNGGAGCETEQKANNEKPANTVEERIANFRAQIEAEKAATGKDYLSFYHIVADSYSIK